MYSVEEFDIEKSKVMKFILYKKRTEQEVKNKFATTIQSDLLCDIIEYVKEAGYLDDSDYIKRSIREIMALKTLSIREIQYKLYAKGIDRSKLEDYLYENREELQQYELEAASRIVEKKKSSLEKEEIKQYLSKKGYQSEIIKEVLECKMY